MESTIFANKRNLISPGIARRARGWLIGLVLAIGLSGCATNRVDFSSWAVGYNNSVDHARNKLMLLNIVRSSENMPLMFTGVQVVRGSGQNSIGAALGYSKVMNEQNPVDAPYPLTVSSIAPSATFQVSSGFNFDVVVLDSAEFLQGLLTPTSVLTFHNLVKHGIPEELLVHLLVDKITITKITPTGPQTLAYVNDPLSQNYKDFRIAVSELMEFGLTTELGSSASVDVGPLLTDADLKSGVATEISKVAPGLFLEKVQGGYRFYRPGGTTANFCFLAENDKQSILLRFFTPTSLCADAESRMVRQNTSGDKSPDMNKLSSNRGSISLKMRSTSGVFAYLGSLMRYQAKSNNEFLTLDSSEIMSYNRLDKSRAVFRVVKNQAKANDIVSVEYGGTVYSMPLEEQGFSAITLTVLNMLFSLSKSVNSVPSTGTVVVR